MFGYVVANRDKLTEEEIEIYGSCYCGLCKTLKKRGPFISTLTLNYDMAFLVLMLLSSYETEYEKKLCRCFLKCKKKSCFSGEVLEFAADMNIILSYYKMYDDWKDDKNIVKLIFSKLIKNSFDKATEKHSEKSENIKKYLAELREYENKNSLEPDAEAEIFGKIMGEIFSFQDDKFNEFAIKLGKFIFIMDAVMDLKSDIKKKRYNPLILTDSSLFENMLNMLMADCVEAYEKLEIVKNKDLIENILFSGVWSKFALKKHKEEKK